jgi:hypothetical protein
MILSTPVCGVDIRNEIEAPFEAPFLKIETPVGITPQEHKGKGIPIRAALSTDLILELPSKRFILPSGKNTCKMPAIRNPSKSQGAMSNTKAANFSK